MFRLICRAHGTGAVINRVGIGTSALPRRALLGLAVLGLGVLLTVPLAPAVSDPPTRGQLTPAAVGSIVRGPADPLVAGGGLLRAGSRSAGPGYTLERALVGQTPRGVQVWVSRTARHRAAIARGAAAAVRELRGLGLAVQWRGYGTPRAGEGIIRISERSAGCVRGTSVVGMTSPYWRILPTGAYLYRAEIALCPMLFRRYPSRDWVATVRHEMGHAMGLGHTNYRYQGSYQLMNAVLQHGVTDYRAGDRRGLRVLAADTRRLKTELPPVGRIARSFWSYGSIHVTGSAVLQYSPATPVTITMTDNGRTSAHTGTRGHQFTLSVPWRGGVHRYCVTASPSRHPAAATPLGCVTWSG